MTVNVHTSLATTDASSDAIASSPLGRIDWGSVAITALTLAAALVFVFPLYWALVTSVKPEVEVVEPGVSLWPRNFTLDAYVQVFTTSKILVWYLNSVVTSLAVTVLVVASSIGCGYALSQLRFPGRRLLYGLILASFMVPISALIVNHFLLVFRLGIFDTWAGIVLPQLIHPVVIIIYKQFFDAVPKEFREAAVIDGANHFDLLFKVYMPMNWSITAAMALVTFISAWNNFLWPFLAQNSQDTMNVTVGITQVKEAYGIRYARELAAAVIAGLPMAFLYLAFQRQVTRAIMLSGGLKG